MGYSAEVIIVAILGGLFCAFIPSTDNIVVAITSLGYIAYGFCI